MKDIEYYFNSNFKEVLTFRKDKDGKRKENDEKNSHQNNWNPHCLQIFTSVGQHLGCDKDWKGEKIKEKLATEKVILLKKYPLFVICIFSLIIFLCSIFLALDRSNEVLNSVYESYGIISLVLLVFILFSIHRIVDINRFWKSVYGFWGLGFVLVLVISIVLFEILPYICETI